MNEKVQKTEDEWRKILDPATYEVCRCKGTERPFTGRYWNFWEDGVYRCACCGSDLFSSGTKFDAGCGWPSFWDALEPGRVILVPDLSHGMRRTEVTCARCGAHLGHVFDDGPEPSGDRYCINSASIRHEPLEEQKG